jgi:nucleoside-diphosphate-sugar epimerase
MDLRGKKVLVTGSCGFIGSHLVEKLAGVGCKVKAFVLYNSFNSLGWIDSFPKETLKKIDVVVGDIRDSGNVGRRQRGWM